jgi:hypothetical protein
MCHTQPGDLSFFVDCQVNDVAFSLTKTLHYGHAFLMMQVFKTDLTRQTHSLLTLLNTQKKEY